MESPLPPIERGGKGGGLFRTGESSEELIEKMLKEEDGLSLLTLDDLREFAKAYSSKKKKAVKYRGEVRSLIELIHANGYSVKKKVISFMAARLLNMPRPKMKGDIDNACLLLARQIFPLTPQEPPMSIPPNNGEIPPWDESLPPQIIQEQRPLSPKCKRKGALRRTKKMDDREFYDSWEWKSARYEALKRYGARCMVCGATPADGARICVDHIKPRSRYPELQLDIDNLQILCNDCNMGKGNWDETDWRKE